MRTAYGCARRRTLTLFPLPKRHGTAVEVSPPMNSQPGFRLSCPRPDFRAFTRIELLAVLAALAFLGLLVQPALSESRSASRAALCLNNQQRLQKAWAANAVDNQGWLVISDGSLPNNAQRQVWLQPDRSFQSPDAGNLKFITNGPLFRYVGGQAAVYKCPADRSASESVNGAKGIPRISSFSMNQAFGSGFWLPDTRWRTYARDAQIVNPVKTFVFADEHPDSINDGGLATASDRAQSLTERGNIIDMPSSLHEGAGVFAFADGSADLHRWKGRTIRPPVTYNGALELNVPALDSQVDIVWLAAHTTVRR